ncbi:serpin B3-like [Platysternon megacephalum]|uniref:ATP-dependent helicase n=1 Tax=Platysternon megacephalum TaxID=55544 RepID=A0A4D9DBF0_9SAUR|nr:ATP-dependent helicase [Platysternon megacephalum]TFK12747.1 serpin B3-like [Platysternon megacephalum]
MSLITSGAKRTIMKAKILELWAMTIRAPTQWLAPVMEDSLEVKGNLSVLFTKETRNGPIFTMNLTEFDQLISYAVDQPIIHQKIMTFSNYQSRSNLNLRP